MESVRPRSSGEPVFFEHTLSLSCAGASQESPISGLNASERILEFPNFLRRERSPEISVRAFRAKGRFWRKATFKAALYPHRSLSRAESPAPRLLATERQSSGRLRHCSFTPSASFCAAAFFNVSKASGSRGRPSRACARLDPGLGRSLRLGRLIAARQEENHSQHHQTFEEKPHATPRGSGAAGARAAASPVNMPH